MSKNKKKNNYKRNIKLSSDVRDSRQISVKQISNSAPDPLKMALMNALGCNNHCQDDFAPFKFGNYKKLQDWKLLDEEIDYLVHNTPTFMYVTKKLTSLKFSNGITCFDDTLSDEVNKRNDKHLKDFLYTKNIEGVSNYSVIQEAFEKAPYRGRAGIRVLNKQDGFVYVDSSHYIPITLENEEHRGVYETPFYLISTGDNKLYDMSWDELTIKFDVDTALKLGEIYDEENKLLLIHKSKFISIRDDLSTEEPTSIFESDQQRVKLLLSAYLRMNYDIEYDGVGRILLRLKNGIGGYSPYETSTGETVKHTLKSDEERLVELNSELQGILQGIKKSGSTSVIALSDIFEKDITHLPRKVDGKDYINWTESMEGVIVCNLYGIDPILAGFGKFSGNISMESKIDQEMLNGIVPLRERQMIQIAPMLMELLNLPKVYFNMYDLKQKQDDSIEVFRYMQSLKIAKEAERIDLVELFEKTIKSKI